METKYGQELVRDLNRVRELVKKTIQKSQRSQKKFYDQRCKEVKLKVGDLVMLKSEPRFCFDRSYKRPFVIRSLSITNADIQLKEDSRILDVCRQHLSLCSLYMSQSIPWVGHSGKLRKRCQVH